MAAALAFGARPSRAPGFGGHGYPDAVDDEALELRVASRWRRMIMRVQVCWAWAKEGLHLALVKRPDLRYLPFPWPSVSSVAMWKSQAETLCQHGAYPRRWLGRGLWTASTLASMTWFCGRFGLPFAFLEDPLLQGMLAVTSTRGRAARVRAAMVKEAAEEASKEADRLKVARTLIGPRGGLPTLKADLLRLASLLNVTVSEKDKVDDLKAKIRPMIGLLKVDEKTASKPAALRFYELLLAPFVETHAAYLDKLAFAIGGPGFLADFGAHARGGPWREHECFHVVEGGHGPPIPGDAGRRQRSAADHAQPGAPARDADAERPADRRHRDGGRPGLGQRAPAGARGEREHQPDDGPPSGAAGLPTGAVVNKLKPGQRQLITQAWARHRREQLLISCTPGQVRHALTAEYFAGCRRALNEAFVFEVPLLAAEAVAPLDVVSRQALVRGHTIAGPWLHGSEFDLTLRQDGRRVLPYFVVLTVPDRSWLPRARLRQRPDDIRQQRAEALLLLLNFAARLAREQVRGGRHFVFRLPLASAAWRALAMRRLRHGLGLHFVTVMPTGSLLRARLLSAICFGKTWPRLVWRPVLGLAVPWWSALRWSLTMRRNV